jgi:hypothetical protein
MNWGDSSEDEAEESVALEIICKQNAQDKNQIKQFKSFEDEVEQQVERSKKSDIYRKSERPSGSEKWTKFAQHAHTQKAEKWARIDKKKRKDPAVSFSSNLGLTKTITNGVKSWASVI